ncbi:hypothetical protein KSP40_PGU005313 [Platanthera guangdongensis]|uniref:DUF1771 domain-containing protein n=1 Tax=Platanthera guangdongensis TaxID=2320717 RepID=A0ABR2LQ77_9ASPA
MASSSSCTTENEDVQLKSLFDTFCSVCSVQDIALAYINAGHNVEMAGHILCNDNKNMCDASDAYNCEKISKNFEESSQKGDPDNSVSLSGISNVKKPKRTSVSAGSVSSLLGKSYFRPISSINEPSQATKPLKVNVFDSTVTQSGLESLGSKPLAEKNALDSISKQTSISNTDMEEFMFSMLGDGFQLSMDSIREVLGNCGYNAKQSMEKLLSLSPKVLDKGKAVEHNSHRDKWLDKETSCYEGECKKFPPQSYSNKFSTEKTNLSREVLESLFSTPDIFEEPKVRRLEWGLNRTRVTGQKPVTMPFEVYDLSQIPKTELIEPDNRKDDEEQYQALRKAAKQQWDTMKIYYEAAIDAFTNNDRTRLSYFLEQGKHCYEMAREADEKSSGLILEKGEPDENGNDLPLDLHAQSVNESIRLLKLHLLSLAGISSFRCLKVTINTDDGESSKGKRRRKKVLQLLEDESISWSEVEGSPGIILIPLDEIDPSMLSFEIDY